MQNLDELRGENELLRNRISRLTAASLRISASLDLDTVLREIVESARELTGADCGVITTLDASGQVEDFVSSGFTAEEHQQLTDWSASSAASGTPCWRGWQMDSESDRTSVLPGAVPRAACSSG